MPIALDPDSTFEVVLESDQNKPKENQPTFTFRVLTGRDWLRVTQLSDKAETGEDSVKLVYQSIQVGLVGWRNMVKPDGSEIPFEPKDLDAILTPAEANEMLEHLMNQRLSLGDKKKSDSPSDSDTVESVKNVQG